MRQEHRKWFAPPRHQSLRLEKNIYRLLHGSLIFFTVFRAFLETLPGMVLGVAFTVGSSAPSAAGIRTRVTRAGVSSAAPLRFSGLDACFGEIVPLSDWFMAAYTDCCSSGFKKGQVIRCNKGNISCIQQGKQLRRKLFQPLVSLNLSPVIPCALRNSRCGCAAYRSVCHWNVVLSPGLVR